MQFHWRIVLYCWHVIAGAPVAVRSGTAAFSNNGPRAHRRAGRYRRVFGRTRSGLVMLLPPVMVTVVLAGCASSSGAVAGPRNDGSATCQQLLERASPLVARVYYRDSAASYWLAPFTLPSPGAALLISGRFPYARYLSLTTQDSRLRSEDTIDDDAFRAGRGVTNPFAAGAPRDNTPRDFTVSVRAGLVPSSRAAGTLYTGTAKDGLPVTRGFLVYRVYVPDDPRSVSGGEPLPRIELRAGGRAVRNLAWSSCQSPQARLSEAELDRPDNRAADRLPVAQAVNRLRGHDDDPPQWTVGSDTFLTHSDRFGYFVLQSSRQFGPILEISGRAPTFPSTRGAGQPRMPDPPRMLRYWSLCQYQPLRQGRSGGCVADYQFRLDSTGDFHLVISAPDQRPANATLACGFNWIPWGPQSLGAVQYRQFLASPAFTQGAYGLPAGSSDAQIRAATGPYYPLARYFPSKQAFQRQGCR